MLLPKQLLVWARRRACFAPGCSSECDTRIKVDEPASMKIMGSSVARCASAVFRAGSTGVLDSTLESL